METDQPEMDTRPTTPENLISVQGSETQFTGKTAKFNKQHVCKDEFFPDQHPSHQENNLALKREEPESKPIKEEELEPLEIKEEREPRRIKEEVEEFWSRQEIEQFIQKQKIDIVTVSSTYVENDLREAGPISDQLLCLTSAVTENQDEEGSRHVDPGSAESELLKMKKRRLKTRIHSEDATHVHKDVEVLQIQKLWFQERNSFLDQEGKDPALVKEEEEELCISQAQEHFGLKQETDTFMVTPTYEDNDNGETGSKSGHLIFKSSTDADSQNGGAGKNVDPGSTKYEEPNSEKRLHRNGSHSSNVDNSFESKNLCNTDNSGKSVECAINQKGFRNQSHMRHYACNISDKPTEYLSYFEQHNKVRKFHKQYSCEECGKQFTENGALTTHMRIHTGDKPYSCKICGKGFSHSSHLNVHMRVHTGDKPYSCKICGKHFTCSSTLTAHMRIHTGDKPYICEECGAHFTCCSHLTSHMRVHTGHKPYFCEKCGKLFTQSSSLKAHVRVHTGDKPYCCEPCGKRFTCSSHLRAHMRIHTGDKRFVCKTCEKSFTHNSTLINHVRIHTGDKPYSCEKCHKCFSQSSHLRRHIKTHTDEQP
ncbi:uncharacterized protein KZ484_026759 [Pholidichthys leucotaenia]